MYYYESYELNKNTVYLYLDFLRYYKNCEVTIIMSKSQQKLS